MPSGSKVGGIRQRDNQTGWVDAQPRMGAAATSGLAKKVAWMIGTASTIDSQSTCRRNSRRWETCKPPCPRWRKIRAAVRFVEQAIQGIPTRHLFPPGFAASVAAGAELRSSCPHLAAVLDAEEVPRMRRAAWRDRRLRRLRRRVGQGVEACYRALGGRAARLRRGRCLSFAAEERRAARRGAAARRDSRALPRDWFRQPGARSSGTRLPMRGLKRRGTGSVFSASPTSPTRHQE